MLLENQVALVTGASRGIGKAIAHRLAAEGAIVIGTATSESGAQAISDALAAAGLKGSGMKLDVTDAVEVTTVLKDISEHFGAPTVLVNNAGITQDNLLMRMKQEEWDSVIDTDLSSVFRLSKAVMRGMMKARHGRIINITSVVGSMGNPGQANYAAAKAGMIGFSKALAQEVGSRGITVNSVAPGFIDTDMTRALEPAQREALAESVPLKKLGSVDDIANAVLFLASEMGAYITGETLHVNGGMYMN